MKKFLLPLGTVAILGLLAPAVAHGAKADGKKARFLAKYDANGNGELEADEKAAVRADYKAAPDGELKGFDRNNDGELDDAELAAIKPGSAGGRKSDKAKSAKTTR